jgi:hypothetical protein
MFEPIFISMMKAQSDATLNILTTLTKFLPQQQNQPNLNAGITIVDTQGGTIGIYVNGSLIYTISPYEEHQLNLIKKIINALDIPFKRISTDFNPITMGIFPTELQQLIPSEQWIS